MSEKEETPINAVEKRELIDKYIRENEGQLLERYEKLTYNFRWFILKSIELCLKYQEEYY